MRHSDEEIQQAAKRFERLAVRLDPERTEVKELSDLQAVATASRAVQDDEAKLREAVRAARARGRSWNQVATALGVTRQAARQRFTDKVQT